MDLNVCIEIRGVRDPDRIIKEKLDRCQQLGFHTVALSVHIDVSEDDSKTIVIPSPPSKDILSSCPRGLKVFTRLTVKVGTSLQLYKVSKHAETSKYDLIALEPANIKILQHIVQGSAELDILTFDLSEKLDPHMYRCRYKVLQDRGVCIEMNYGPAQLGSTLRRNVICNGQNLVEKINRNLILSSGVQDIFRLRGPKDAEHLGVLFMVPLKKCHDLVFRNAKLAIDASKHRRNPISSAIELVKENNSNGS